MGSAAPTAPIAALTAPAAAPSQAPAAVPAAPAVPTSPTTPEASVGLKSMPQPLLVGLPLVSELSRATVATPSERRQTATGRAHSWRTFLDGPGPAELPCELYNAK